MSKIMYAAATLAISSGLFSCSSAQTERDPAASEKGFFERVDQYSREQAQRFSDETLVQKANAPDWMWLWQKPVYLVEEVERRSAVSPERALALANVFLRSFVNQNNLHGTEVHALFMHALAKAGQPKAITGEWLECAKMIGHLSKSLYQDLDRATLKEARGVLAKNIQAAASLKTTFDDKFSYFSFVTNTVAEDPELAWLAKELEVEIGALMNQLFDLGEKKQFDYLFGIYKQNLPGVNRDKALQKLAKLNPAVIRTHISARLAAFPVDGNFAEIAGEVSLLRAITPGGISPDNIPKLTALVKAAEARKDLASKALIFSSMGVKEGGRSLKWSQVYPGVTDDASCFMAGELASEFYRRNLLAPGEIQGAVGDLRRCLRPGSKDEAFEALLQLCQDASRAKDAGLATVCSQDLQGLLITVGLKERSDKYMRGVRKIYEMIPVQARVNMPRTCRVGMRVSTGGDKKKSDIRFFHTENNQLKVKDCKDWDISRALFVGKYFSGSYLSKEGRSLDLLADVLRGERHNLSACFQMILTDPSFPKVVAREIGRAGGAAQNVRFTLEEYVNLPVQGDVGSHDSCAN
jgi:hypothetical protein